MDVTIRELHTMPEFEVCVQLQRDIWGMAEHNLAAAPVMMATVHNGGIVHGAIVEGKIVAFSFGLVGKRGDTVLIWSHMAGVLPDYQGLGIGRTLKLAQYTWAQAHGFAQIAWTFDPLQRGNANFNLHKLGVIAYHFHPNHYGEMTDVLNRGMASDRLEATWHITDQPAIGKPALVTSEADVTFLVERGNLNTLPAAGHWHAPAYAIEIPYDLLKLKRENLAEAVSWQSAVREAMSGAFAEGYAATDFVQEADRCWYVLRRRPHDPA